jgi:hypothetical protein
MRWWFGTANHATDRLEILRVSFFKRRKKGVLEKTLSLYGQGEGFKKSNLKGWCGCWDAA